MVERLSGERVLVIDGSRDVRRDVGAQLGALGLSVLAEERCGDLDPLLRVFHPMIAIVDVDGEDPRQIVRALRHVDSVAVILITENDLDHRVKAFDAGADDVIVKPFAVDELVARVCAVLARTGHVPNVVHFADLVIDEGAHTVQRGDHLLELTATEFTLLTTLCQHAGVVLSKRQLLSRVWGFELYHVNVVEVHICALRRKLEACGPRLIHTVRGVGYVARVSRAPAYSPALTSRTA
jgi:two-component system, OmpR family, response regulator